MSLEELALEHQHQQMALIVKNAAPGSRNPEELLTALRHGLAGWMLCEANEQQIFEIVDRYKSSHNN